MTYIDHEKRKKTSDQLFAEKMAAVPDDVLLIRAKEELGKLCQTGGRSLTMRVPPMVIDTDMVFSELIRRYTEKIASP